MFHSLLFEWALHPYIQAEPYFDTRLSYISPTSDANRIWPVCIIICFCGIFYLKAEHRLFYNHFDPECRMIEETPTQVHSFSVQQLCFLFEKCFLFQEIETKGVTKDFSDLNYQKLSILRYVSLHKSNVNAVTSELFCSLGTVSASLKTKNLLLTNKRRGGCCPFKILWWLKKPIKSAWHSLAC